MSALAYGPTVLGVGGVAGSAIWLVSALLVAPWTADPVEIASRIAIVVGVSLASVAVLLIGSILLVAGGARS